VQIFLQNSSPDTNEWAAKLLGERWLTVTGTNVGRSGGQEGSTSAGVTRSEQRRYFVEPSRFATLKRGGDKYGRQVEAVVYLGGHQFPGIDGKDDKQPYMFLTFNEQ
jgi:hypothetical protein